jgi:hypothetical protein
LRGDRRYLAPLGVSVIFLLAFLICLRDSLQSPEPPKLQPHDLLPKSRAPAEIDPACQSTYQRLYEKQPMRIAVAFGYKDARPARFVGDRYEKLVLLSYLLAPCPPGFWACGFQRDPQDADLFRKTIDGYDGKPRTVELTVTHSSVGPDDDANRNDRFQAWQSRYAEARFLESLRTADVVLYDGHSRDGGGADFSPPRLKPDLHVDYYSYLAKKEGLHAMLRQLTQPGDRPRLLGLFSCASSKLFSRQLAEVRPKLAILSSEKLLYYADATRGLLATLSSLLAEACQPQFDSALRAGSNGESLKLTGFFD